MVNAIWFENGCEINAQTVSMRKFEYRLKSKSSVYGKLSYIFPYHLVQES
jgi:hypothetical protein